MTGALCWTSCVVAPAGVMHSLQTGMEPSDPTYRYPHPAFMFTLSSFASSDLTCDHHATFLFGLWYICDCGVVHVLAHSFGLAAIFVCIVSSTCICTAHMQTTCCPYHAICCKAFAVQQEVTIFTTVEQGLDRFRLHSLTTFRPKYQGVSGIRMQPQLGGHTQLEVRVLQCKCPCNNMAKLCSEV